MKQWRFKGATPQTALSRDYFVAGAGVAAAAGAALPAVAEGAGAGTAAA